MHKSLVALILCAAAWPGAALACSCVQPEAPLSALEKSAAVFSGRVAEITQSPLSRGSADPVRVTFHLKALWKGEFAPQTTVVTAASSASCGYPFAVGEEYLVYAMESEDGLSASLCSRTAPLANAADDLTALAGKPVISFGEEATLPTPERGWKRYAVLAAVAVGAAAIAALLKKRRAF